ncbi:FGGY-family carbohydrate kinase [Pleomorphomonas sp. PLEO]|uniref:FGGY-family carbohydrate kinase n=1 Tax=Pleomorphomonas sp. PLEO TaxID=3239306 RepID=UPI00351DFA21
MTQAIKLIGIDIGTSSVKAVRVRADDGVAVEAAVSKPYAADGAPTRDPTLWTRLAEEALDELTRGETIAAIGFTGQMHAMVAVADDGALAAPVKLWLDMDGAPDLDAFVAAYPGSFATDTGNIPLPDFTLAKWLWASRLDPRLAKRVGGLYCAKDYVRAALDPSAPFVVDRNEATGMQVFDPFADRWHEGILERAGLPMAALPKLVSATQAAGAWRGIPMVVGVGDQAAAARAIGALVPGVASLSLGTSGVLSIPLMKSALPASWDGAFHLFPTGFDDNYQVIGTVPAFGATLRWLQTLFGRSMAELDAAAADRPIGEGRALFVPYLAGAGAPHPDHALAAALSGLTVDTDLPAIVRAVYDGMAQELAAITEEAAAIGAPTDAILLSGGATHLPGLVATLAAFLPSECRLVDAAEASAVGAALAGLDHLRPANRLSLTTTAVPRGQSHALRDDWRRARQAALAGRHVHQKG